MSLLVSPQNVGMYTQVRYMYMYMYMYVSRYGRTPPTIISSVHRGTRCWAAPRRAAAAAGRGIYIPGECFIARYLFYSLCTSCGRGIYFYIPVTSRSVSFQSTLLVCRLRQRCTHFLQHRARGGACGVWGREGVYIISTHKPHNV